MRTRSLILLVLLVTLPGCITYRDSPIVNPLPIPYETAAPPHCRLTVQFPGGMEEGWLPFRPTYQWTYRGVGSRLSVDRALEDALQHYAGCSSSPPLVYNSTWAETEIVVSVLEIPYPWYSRSHMEFISA